MSTSATNLGKFFQRKGDERKIALIQCCTDLGSSRRRIDSKYWTNKERMEWQANTMFPHS